MKMLRAPWTQSSNRSLLVLLVLFLALVGIAAGRTLMGSSFGPAAPVYRPAENPAPPAIYPAPPTAGSAATTVPHATVPVGPATSATPGGDIHSIAPEGTAPGFNPPPGRE